MSEEFVINNLGDLRLSKLHNHLEKNHSGRKNKDIECFINPEAGLKDQLLDKAGSFRCTDKKLTEESFEISLMIAKQRKAQNISETFVKPSALALDRFVFFVACNCELMWEA